jgi:hypothetical protein
VFNNCSVPFCKSSIASSRALMASSYLSLN